MDKNKVYFMNMANTVIIGMDTPTELWNNKKPLADSVMKIKSYKSELEGLALDQASGTTKGATQVLQTNFDNMVELAMQIIQKLPPFAQAAPPLPLVN